MLGLCGRPYTSLFIPHGTASGAPMEFEDTIKTRFTLLRSVVWYLEQFENDPCETVILADGRPAVELSFRCRSITDWSYVGIWTVWWTFRAVNMS